MADTIPVGEGTTITEDQFKQSGGVIEFSNTAVIFQAPLTKKDVVQVFDQPVVVALTPSTLPVEFQGDYKSTFLAGLTIAGSTLDDNLVFGATDGEVKTKFKDLTVNVAGDGVDNLVGTKKTSIQKSTFIVDDKDTFTTKKGETLIISENLNAKGKLKGGGIGGVTFEVQ